VETELALAQTQRYAQELRTIYDRERKQRQAVERALGDLERSYRTTVSALAAALELRDDQTGGHAERVARLGVQLAAEIAPELAAENDLEYGFLLHDLGKIGVPDAILLKPGPLDESERAVMQTHPLLGAQIIADIPYLGPMARAVVVSHHERWDGNGYPHGLAGEQIPLCARIFAVVDAYDAMTTDRPYRPALPSAFALGEIKHGGGTQFDPRIARVFVERVGALRAA
jgi:HD-GYP domain-containing protein (c-di-GMP phosphodiesterase class II)